MGFDQSTRNRLARFVAKTRSLLAKEFARQLQSDFGMDPGSGDMAELDRLGNLNDADRETALLLRETLHHYAAQADTGTPAKAKKARQDALERIVREQAFTILNRLCALRMSEARGLLIESIAKGHRSQGFQLYQRLAGTALGETGSCYRAFLNSISDEFAEDLGILFDRFSPMGRLFPKEACLQLVLDEIDHPDLDTLWAEDETIGWVYQYYNDQDERKQMRKASARPRDSRELAVRNQFFTPRYVVEFLTDNTLGRLWYEMMRGETRLADLCRYMVCRPEEVFLRGDDDTSEVIDEKGVSEEELLHRPHLVAHRPIKDPREIRLLDPACGSMHFGLYAFDLLEAVYEEAWDTASIPELKRDYQYKDDLLKDVPRLIIEENLHGIDIDPRAVQVAGLSLWLRAQKAWQAMGLKPTDRPAIRRSNLVAAEPMPDSTSTLEDFLATLKPSLLGELVRTVFEKMQLAGEAGTLLRIEEEVRTAIEDARKAWEKLETTPMELFPQEELNRVTKEAQLTLLEKAVLADRTSLQTAFWDSAERRVVDALRSYAEQAETDDYRRRLFAADTGRGFSFIDLCRKRYDVVVMNPPFGRKTPAVLPRTSRRRILTHRQTLHLRLSSEHWEWSSTSLRWLEAITTRTGFFLSSLRRWRESVLASGDRLTCCADLGYGVLDALVETAAYVVKRGGTSSGAVFIDVLDTRDKEEALLEAIKSFTPRFHLAESDSFKRSPRVSFAYWAPGELSASYARARRLEPTLGSVKRGVATGDNDRFLRLFWEVSPLHVGPRRDWVWYAKGGEYSPYHISTFLVLKWKGDGAEAPELHHRTGSSARGPRTWTRSSRRVWRMPPEQRVDSRRGSCRLDTVSTRPAIRSLSMRVCLSWSAWRS